MKFHGAPYIFADLYYHILFHELMQIVLDPHLLMALKAVDSCGTVHFNYVYVAVRESSRWSVEISVYYSCLLDRFVDVSERLYGVSS